MGTPLPSLTAHIAASSWPHLQPAPLVSQATSVAPSRASFGRKRQLSAEPEVARAAPASQQQRQQQVAKRQRQAPTLPHSKPPAAGQPPSGRSGSQRRATPQSQAARHFPPASQAEALFDSLFGGPEVGEPAPRKNDLAAAVQRQLARSVARHAQRIARSRQHHAGGGNAVWLNQPVEDTS